MLKVATKCRRYNLLAHNIIFMCGAINCPLVTHIIYPTNNYNFLSYKQILKTRTAQQVNSSSLVGSLCN